MNDSLTVSYLWKRSAAFKSNLNKKECTLIIAIAAISL